MKKFKGFNPDQQFKLLSGMGYQGPKDPKLMADFVASTPGADSKMMEYAKMAQARLGGGQKEPVKMATGGYTRNTESGKWPNTNTTTRTTSTTNTGTDTGTDTSGDTSGTADTSSETGDNTTTTETTTGETALTGPASTQTAITDPSQFVTQAEAAQVPVEDNQFVDPNTGQVTGDVKAGVSTVDSVATATAPTKTEAETVDAALVGDKIDTTLGDLQAATADPSAKATVKGQLETLMSDFEGGATPVWASGAMRQAMGIMQARGLGASSMAGQAVVQAAMESAIAIASQDAQTNAQFEMANLNNEQQTLIFKTQQRITGLLSDQAQENAAAQFNASSKNQVNQFFAGLEESVSKFNAEMVNAISKFNAGEENANEQFNANIQNLRDQFNAQNSLIIAQANAKWRQDIATLDTAAQNEANLTNAKNLTGLTMAGLDELWQRERDLLAMAYNSYESKLDRDTQILLADKEIKAADEAGKGQLVGIIAGGVINNLDTIGGWF